MDSSMSTFQIRIQKHRKLALWILPCLLTTKLENIGSTPEVCLVEIPEIIKKDASTFCFDLIDYSNLCNQVLVKNVIVEICSNEVAKENEQLRQKVACLGKALYDKKGKVKQIQPA